jgi:signal transduction histidine kinase
LTSINYNGIERSPKKPIELRSGDKNIRFAFNATTFTSPHNVQYRYRLKGLSESWSETDRPYAQFTGLPAGNYTFEVMAAGARQSQYGKPIAYSFQIPQPFYQQPVFWMAILSLMTMLMYALHRYRIRTIVQVERTRTQIAMDLHDDIGSSLTSLSFMSNLAWQRTEQQTPKEEITPLLREMGTMSSELVDNMLDIVWSVDPKQDSVGSIVTRLQSFCQRMQGTSQITVTWTLGSGVQDLPLPPRSRRNLYLILKESINNAVKHSRANCIEIAMEPKHGMLDIAVQDDGAGFDAGVVKSGYGLKTMRERAEESGASLKLESQPGLSTTVVLRWPLKFTA